MTSTFNSVCVYFSTAAAEKLHISLHIVIMKNSERKKMFAQAKVYSFILKAACQLVRVSVGLISTNAATAAASRL